MKQAKFSEIKKRVIPQEGTITHPEEDGKVKIKNVSGIKAGTSGAPIHKRFWEERVKKASELTASKKKVKEIKASSRTTKKVQVELTESKVSGPKQEKVIQPKPGPGGVQKQRQL